MSVNTKILLPLHVRNNRLMMVIAKCMGEPFEYAIFTRSNGRIALPNNAAPFVDPGKPASRENSWHIHFPGMRGGGFGIAASELTRDMSHGEVLFTDPAGTQYRWSFHPDTEHEDGKLLLPGSYALAVALGARLVRFFGGRLVADDTSDKPTLVVSNTRAMFPRKRREQSSDDRWDQFQNALREVTVLTAEELRWGAEKSAMGELSAQCETLCLALDAMASRAALDEACPGPVVGNRSRHRM